MLLLALLLTAGPVAVPSQTKKGTYYYAPYRRHNQPGKHLPIHVKPEKFGWSTLIAGQQLPDAFAQRNRLRATLLYEKAALPLKSVVEIFKLDPKSGDGRFLLQFYLFLSGRTYKIPTTRHDSSDKRLTMLDFFTSLKKGDIDGMATRLSLLGLTNDHRLRLLVYLANQMLINGFEQKAYTLFRNALRMVEVNTYGLKLSWKEQQSFYRYLVLRLAAITHQRGEYRKAYGILKWAGKTSSGQMLQKVNCTVRSIIEGTCRNTQAKNSLPQLLTLSTEDKAYTDALLSWRQEWSRGVAAFTAFMQQHPASRRRLFLARFIKWLNKNPK